MIYSVYALREVGTTDIRYIGQTRYDGARRLRFLSYLARKGNGEPNMREWLESIQYCAEAVAIAFCTCAWMAVAGWVASW